MPFAGDLTLTPKEETQMRFVIAAVLISITGGAHAGGPTVVTDEPEVSGQVAPSGKGWTGFYFGASTISTKFAETFAAQRGKRAMGLHVGYLRDLGRLVVGGELATRRVR
jgi:outer membrane immunogenic protein